MNRISETIIKGLLLVLTFAALISSILLGVLGVVAALSHFFL